MSVIHELACSLNRRDEVPNQELARKLALQKNKAGIQEIAENLWNKNQEIQSDCVKVVYEIGYIAPELIEDYVQDFIKLLFSKHNRLVWGGMIALGTVAGRKPREILERLNDILKIMASGSVITVDNGVKVLAKAAACGKEYSEAIFPHLIEHLKTCRPKEVAQHAESSFGAVNDANKIQFVEALNLRLPMVTAAQEARIRKLLKKLEK
jgi:hypothetical protein